MMETGTPKGQAPCFNVGDNSTVYEDPTPPPGTHTEANLFAGFSPHSYPASLTPRRILPENISVNHMYPIPISGFALAFPPAAAQCTTRAFPGLTVSSSTSHPFHPAPPSLCSAHNCPLTASSLLFFLPLWKLTLHIAMAFKI